MRVLTGLFDWARSDLTGPFDWARSDLTGPPNVWSHSLSLCRRIIGVRERSGGMGGVRRWVRKIEVRGLWPIQMIIIRDSASQITI